MNRRYAVIMAGGSGERFWPVSTKERPKQFLKLSSPEKSLLQEAVERAVNLVGADSTIIATGLPFAERSAQECNNLSADNVWAEPAKRNTTGCQVWVAANLLAMHAEDWANVSIAVLTADHRIVPPEGFQSTVENALDQAEKTGALVTIGIWPSRPETGYGYIELGEPIEGAHHAHAFREKPDLATAEQYLESKRHLWNSGMFFWTLAGFMAELEQAQPEIAAITRSIAGLIKSGNLDEAKRVFETLPSVSIDYALMEKAQKVVVVDAQFEWDDLGAWDSLNRSYQPDENDNVSLGTVRLVDSNNCVVYNETTGQKVNLLGLEGVIVVATDTEILVCPADRAQEVRRLASEP